MITSEADWVKEYRKQRDHVWIVVSWSVPTDSGKIYFKSSDFHVWKTIVENQESKSRINGIELRFRSNSVNIDTSSWEAVYLIRSAMGSIGGSTRDYLIVGKISGQDVEKTMWLLPALIVETIYQDTIDSCFLEAVIFNGGKKN